MFGGGKFHASVNCPVHEEDCLGVSLGSLCAVSRRELGAATQLASGERQMKGHLGRKSTPVS